MQCSGAHCETLSTLCRRSSQRRSRSKASELYLGPHAKRSWIRGSRCSQQNFQPTNARSCLKHNQGLDRYVSRSGDSTQVAFLCVADRTSLAFH